MIRQPVTLPAQQPLNRPLAVQLVKTANRFAARLMMEQGDKLVNAKSMLGLLAVGFGAQEAPLYLVAEGEDEQEAVDAILSVLSAS